MPSDLSLPRARGARRMHVTVTRSQFAARLAAPGARARISITLLRAISIGRESYAPGIGPLHLGPPPHSAHDLDRSQHGPHATFLCSYHHVDSARGEEACVHWLYARAKAHPVPAALPFVANFAAGAIAGISEILTFYPLGELSLAARRCANVN